MTYSVGGLIAAADFNDFAGNMNSIWSTGATDSGWGQTALGLVAAQTNSVAATNWASLVNTLSLSGSQTSTTLTSRTAPTAGTVIAVLTNVATDISSVTTRRGYASVATSPSTTWTGSIAKTTGTGSGTSAWTITWTQTITFPSADQARYFWNAGGLVLLTMNKSSTGTDIDPDWNTFVGTVGQLYLSGRVNNAAQTIGGTVYTGVTRVGGSGTPAVYSSTTGWYNLVAGASATILFKLNSSVYPYTADYVQVTGAVNAGRTVLTLVTTWSQSTQFYPTAISGGTDTTSPYSAFGTAPAVLCRWFQPSTTYLTNSWGTPAVASSVA